MNDLTTLYFLDYGLFDSFSHSSLEQIVAVPSGYGTGSTNSAGLNSKPVVYSTSAVTQTQLISQKFTSLPRNIDILNQEGPSQNKSVYTKNWPPKDKMAVNSYFTQPTTHFIEA